MDMDRMFDRLFDEGDFAEYEAEEEMYRQLGDWLNGRTTEESSDG